MEVPHLHHKLVYEALVMVIEYSHEKTKEVMCKLLHSLFSSFQRVFDQIVNICSDVPKTYLTLEGEGVEVITT